MAIEKFTFESLATIDGGALRVMFDQELRRARLDCEDRPRVDKERTITLTAKLVPVSNEQGDFDTCDVSFDISAKLPKRSTPAINMKVLQGQLLFNEFSPDDVRQGTLDTAGPQTAVSGDDEEQPREEGTDAV